MIALLLSLTASASDVITYSAVAVVEHGAASPTFTVHPRIDGRVKVDITCGSRSWQLDQSISSGRDVTLELDGMPEGHWSCSGTLILNTADGGEGQMPLHLKMASLPIIEWNYSLEDVDLDAHTLVVHPSRPLRAGELQIISEGGAVLATSGADLSDVNHPTFSWTGDAEVVKLVVTGEDEHGFRSQLELSPWSYAIPHEDVVFASGQHDIGADELPKLESCWTDVVDVQRRYGSVVVIKLYVGGYTDTVGSAGSNQGLSERRARAIAGWFRQRGFSGEVYYQGFGEDGQAIQTPDETDNAANRRAVYLLAAETPAVNAELPRAAWKRL